MSRPVDKLRGRSATIQVDIKEADKKLLQRETVKAPDGGYGWIVVLASFFCNIIVDGVIFSFGVFLVDVSNDLQVSKGATAWVGSLQTGFYLIVGPFVSYLANKYDCRLVTIIGGIISAIAFAISYKAENIFVLCFTYGILGGIGYGFIYLPAIVIVGFYFDEKRAFATGIAVCGSGIGGFILAPLVRLSISKYGWRLTMAYLAGVNFLCVFFALFFRPLKAEPVEVDEVQKDLLGKNEKNSLNNNLKLYKNQKKEQPVVIDTKAHLTVDLNNNSKQIESKLLLPGSGHLDAYLQANGNEPNSPTSIVSQQEKLYRGRASSVRNDINASFDTQNPMRSRNSSRRLSVSVVNCAVSASLIKLDQRKKIPEEEERSLGQQKPMFDLSLLASPTFLLFSCAGFLTLFGFFIPFMYIVDRAVLLGISADNGAMILSVIGITNTIGRVICGYLTDNTQISAFFINNVALIVGGVLTIILPIYFNTFASLIFYAVVFGFSIACFAALRSIMTTELFGLERLTDAFGLLLLIQGIATMIGAPIAGWFYDLTKSYNASFYAAGTVILLSGLLCIPLPWVKEREEQKRTKAKLNLKAQKLINNF